MENINIAEILKDCPKGMELDCVMYENVVFDGVSDNTTYPIDVLSGDMKLNLTKTGGYSNSPDAKCVIFPKGKTTWEGFVPPCQFKDGDVVTCTNSACTFVGIFKKIIDKTLFERYCVLILDDGRFRSDVSCSDFIKPRLATEEEKQKLFDAIKANGYKWNEKTKTLKKISPFKAGDVLVSERGNIVLLSHIDNEQIVWYHCVIDTLGDFKIVETPICGVGKVSNCTLASKFQKKRLFSRLRGSGYRWNPQTNKLEKLIEPIFKVGDRITSKDFKNESRVINAILDNEYNLFGGRKIPFSDQNNWELAPNKFDISTLNAFDRVLVRDADDEEWTPNFYGYKRREFQCVQNYWCQCVPYNDDTKHLLGTTDACDEFYETW